MHALSRSPLARVAWALALLLPLAAAQAAELDVSDAWVREAPPGVSVLAAYMQLHNGGDRPRQVVKVASPAFERVEMHRSEMKDGMARMLPVDALIVAPGKTLALAPGGYHLMLFHPKHPLRAGDTVPLDLTLASGDTIPVTAQVRRGSGGMSGMPMQHMH